MRRPSPHRSEVGRKEQPLGFTLLETLVALALLSMIMASMGASINLYWKYRTLSRARVTSSQLMRGLIEDLTSDLRSTVAISVPPLLDDQNQPGQSSSSRPLPNEVNTAIASGMAPAGMEQQLRVQEQHLNLQRNDVGQPVHFIGTRTSLAFLSEQESPRFFQTREYHARRQHHIAWWVNEGRPLRLPLSQAGPRKIQESLEATGLPAGLVRVTKTFGTSTADSKATSGLGTLLSEDVESLAFRYFDGEQWLHEWDSSQRFAIPEAVEIRVMLKQQPNERSAFVVWIPQA